MGTISHVTDKSSDHESAIDERCAPDAFEAGKPAVESSLQTTRFDNASMPGIIGIMSQSNETGSTQQQESGDPNDCGHHTLVKVESKISEADKDVQIYVCTICRKSFAVDAW